MFTAIRRAALNALRSLSFSRVMVVDRHGFTVRCSARVAKAHGWRPITSFAV